MGTLSIGHWVIVLIIVVVVFGTKKLKNIGADLGGAVKGFKDGIKEGHEVKSQLLETSNVAMSNSDPAVVADGAKVASAR